MIPSELIFSGSWQENPWKPQSNTQGDLHHYITEDRADYYDTKTWYEERFFYSTIPADYMKLDVRELFKQMPDQYPTMYNVGRPIKNALKELGVKRFITLEDRGWELSDYWASLEAVYVRKCEYEDKILPRIKAIAEAALATV